MQGGPVIIGATSDIGRAIAAALAAKNERLVVAGRDERELDAVARDLAVRFRIPVEPIAIEATAFETHDAFVTRCRDWLGRVTGVVAGQGCMPPQAVAAADWSEARRMIDVNYASMVSLLGRFAALLEEAGGGYLCAVSSVAGERGRQSNYLYGSTKAALSAYLQGLRNDLHPKGIAVITVKPGFVDTAMTWGLLNPGSPLVASPERVARDIVTAIDRRSNVVYTPGFWRYLMAIIGAIPEPLFKRMKL